MADPGGASGHRPLLSQPRLGALGALFVGEGWKTRTFWWLGGTRYGYMRHFLEWDGICGTSAVYGVDFDLKYPIGASKISKKFAYGVDFGVKILL